MFLLFSAAIIHAQPATNALPALIPAYGEIPPTFLEQHQTAIIITSFALLAFLCLVVKTMRRTESPKVLPPEVVARQALTRLQREPEDGMMLSAVSQILRRYISETFHLPNGELTTAEFIAALAATEKIDWQLGESLCSFLRECDVQKFSKASSATPLNAASRALELIQQAGKRTANPPPQ